MFYGNQQHDSQEFLSFFLDKLSEDLSRVEDDEEDEMQPASK
jgi:ubiquitin C-terminal hydrolase